MQFCKLLSEQNDPDTGPESWVFFDNDKICNEGGKDPGRGVERLLSSRCSSFNEVRDAIMAGIVPEIDVEERSLKLCVSEADHLEDARRTVALK